MNGPIFAVTSDGRRDADVHRQILGAVNFNGSKAAPASIKRGESLGLTIEQVKKLLGR